MSKTSRKMRIPAPPLTSRDIRLFPRDHGRHDHTAPRDAQSLLAAGFLHRPGPEPDRRDEHPYEHRQTQQGEQLAYQQTAERDGRGLGIADRAEVGKGTYRVQAKEHERSPEHP